MADDDTMATATGQTTSETPEDPTPPNPETATFDAPWQARAFALAVALTDENATDRTWRDFQQELVAEIARADATGENAAADFAELDDAALDDAALDDAALDDADETYYRRWLAGLERFLSDRDLIDAEAFTERAAAFAAGDRDAHEFVHGDPHAHTDDLPEGHAEGSHDHAGHAHDH